MNRLRLTEKKSFRLFIAWCITGSTVVGLSCLAYLLNPYNIYGFYFMLGVGFFICPALGIFFSTFVELSYRLEKN